MWLYFVTLFLYDVQTTELRVFQHTVEDEAACHKMVEDHLDKYPQYYASGRCDLLEMGIETEKARGMYYEQ